MIPFIQTNSSVMFVVNGQPYTMQSDYPEYDYIIQLIKNDQKELLLPLLYEMKCYERGPHEITTDFSDITFEYDIIKEEFKRKNLPDISI